MVVQGSCAASLAGDFTKVNAITHNRLARVDSTTGALDATFNPSINNSVRDIELDAANQHGVRRRPLLQRGRRDPSQAGRHQPDDGRRDRALSLTNITGDLAAVTLDGAGGLYVGGSMQFTPEKGNPPALAQVNDLDKRRNRGRALLRDASLVGPHAGHRRQRSPRAGPLRRKPLGGRRLLRLRHHHPPRAGGLRARHRRPRLRVRPQPRRAGQHRQGLGRQPGCLRRRRVPQHRRPATQPAGQAGHRQRSAGHHGFVADANSYVKDMAGPSRTGQPSTSAATSTCSTESPTRDWSRSTPHTGALQANFSMPLTEPTNDDKRGRPAGHGAVCLTRLDSWSSATSARSQVSTGHWWRRST